MHLELFFLTAHAKFRGKLIGYLHQYQDNMLHQQVPDFRHRQCIQLLLLQRAE